MTFSATFLFEKALYPITHALAKMTPLLCVNFLDVVGQDGAQNLGRAYLGTKRLEMTRKW